MMTVHCILPNDVNDPTRPSGGNVYDRRVCDGLRAAGWVVHEHAVAGGWPDPTKEDRARLAGVLASVPDSSTILVDGLVASVTPHVLGPSSARLRIVVLVHMPLGDTEPAARAEEAATLSAAAGVVTTSEWTRRRLIELYALASSRIFAAPPGADPAPLASGTPSGGNLLCVAAVAAHKGHDVLVAALTDCPPEIPWRCLCVGAAIQPSYLDSVRRMAGSAGIGDRVLWVGPQTGPKLDATYAEADLLVLASRGESFGMVVTEALARGVPVVASAAKGLPEALGCAPQNGVPGVLVPPDDPRALATALRRWFGEPGLRRRLRAAACERRDHLTDWSVTTRHVESALLGARR
jgi:glycosyltransferase involved in cell wall biosynthesis